MWEVSEKFFQVSVDRSLGVGINPRVVELVVLRSRPETWEFVSEGLSSL